MNEDSLRRLCVKRNINSTLLHLAIYKELSRSKNHRSTDGIFQRGRKRFPDVSFDTVNRTALTFADIGLVRVIEGFKAGRCFDPNMYSPHHSGVSNIIRSSIFTIKLKTNSSLPGLSQKLSGFEQDSCFGRLTR